MSPRNIIGFVMLGIGAVLSAFGGKVIDTNEINDKLNKPKKDKDKESTETKKED